MIGFVGILVLAGAPLWAPWAQQPSVDLKDAAVVGAGRILFARSCSVGYCHGAEGRAGGGPRLRGKPWEPGYLYRVTAEGIPRSSMPGWKEKLSQDEIWSVVAYVMSLSDPEQSGAAEVASAKAPAPGESAPESGQATDLPEPLSEGGKASAGLTGEPDKGRELFFDAADDLNCGQCHRVRGTGADGRSRSQRAGGSPRPADSAGHPPARGSAFQPTGTLRPHHRGRRTPDRAEGR